MVLGCKMIRLCDTCDNNSKLLSISNNNNIRQKRFQQQLTSPLTNMR